jgi:vancomycin resistance protein YoaR
MTAAQKSAKEKFKKAIAIRSKTGVSLKEAFAQVYGKKVGAVKKKKDAPKKKAVKKVVKKAAPKKAAKKIIQKSKPRYSAKEHKHWGIIPEHKRRVNGVTKKKKVSEQSILNKIHKVKNEVNSLDELQHKHMIGRIIKSTKFYI